MSAGHVVGNGTVHHGDTWKADVVDTVHVSLVSAVPHPDVIARSKLSPAVTGVGGWQRNRCRRRPSAEREVEQPVARLRVGAGPRSEVSRLAVGGIDVAQGDATRADRGEHGAGTGAEGAVGVDDAPEVRGGERRNGRAPGCARCGDDDPLRSEHSPVIDRPVEPPPVRVASGRGPTGAFECQVRAGPDDPDERCVRGEVHHVLASVDAAGPAGSVSGGPGRVLPERSRHHGPFPSLHHPPLSSSPRRGLDGVLTFDSINGVPIAHDNDRGTVLDVASADRVTAADHHHCCGVHGMAGSRLRPARLVALDTPIDARWWPHRARVGSTAARSTHCSTC